MKKARACAVGGTWKNFAGVVGFKITAKGWIRVQQVALGKAKLAAEKGTVQANHAAQNVCSAGWQLKL